MGVNLSMTPDSVEIDNLGGVTLHTINFITNTVNGSGPRGFYSSSLNSIVGYWFNQTTAPTTASNIGVDVSLISAATGQFRFVSSETATAGKLSVLTLT